jgi:hypothetical protein
MRIGRELGDFEPRERAKQTTFAILSPIRKGPETFYEWEQLAMM